jgi:F-type H+-transporting ATPase subunit b
MANQPHPIDTNTDRMNQKHASPAHGEAIPGVEEDAGGGHGPEPTAFGLDATAWVSLAMIVVFAIFLWKKVPGAIASALDKKIATIRAQLAEAEQLRKEAEALRAEYQAKSDAATAEAATMIERARHEADAIVAQAETDTAALIERRTRMAEDKIAAAERHAVEEVRARAARAAAAAAASLISQEMNADTDRALVDRTIAGLTH